MIRFRLSREALLPGLFLLASIIGFTGIFPGIAELVGAGDQSVRAATFAGLWAIAYGSALLLLPFAQHRFIPASLIALGLGCYVLISTTWVQHDNVRLDLAFAFVSTILVAHLCASNFDPVRLLHIIRALIGSWCLVGIAMYAAGVETASFLDGAGRGNILGGDPFKGLFSHKVDAGMYASIGFSLFLADRSRRWHTAFAFVCLAAVVLSASASAILISVFSIVLVVVLRIGRRLEKRLGIVIFLFGGLFLLINLGLGSQLLLDLVGRDASLTGRTGIWAAGAELIVERPILGWGYFGLFDGNGAGPFFAHYYARYYVPVHLQSSYLQIMAELGILGFFLFLWLATVAVKKAIGGVLKNETGYLGIFILLSIVMFYGLAENVFIGNSIGLFAISFVAFLPRGMSVEKTRQSMSTGRNLGW